MSFRSKSKAHGHTKLQNKTPQLTLLYYGRTVRSSHYWRCSIMKPFLKILQYPQQTTVLKSIFKKLQNFRPATLLKRDPDTSAFLWKLQILFFNTILKNICKQLLFNFFNGSVLHGPKGFRSRLYDSIMRQSLTHKRIITGLVFCF